MRKKLTKNTLLPPFMFPAKNKTQQAWMTRLLKEGVIRSIGPRVYTSLPEFEVPTALRGSWSDVVSQLFPSSILSYRSALEYHPTPNGEIFLTGATNRRVHYPGLTLVFIRGPKALPEDSPFLNFHVSSLPRALLENLSSTQKSKGRSLPMTELETRLENILQVKGENELNKIRDQARDISRKLKWKSEFKKLDTLIGSLLGTRPMQNLQSQQAKARAIGKPYESSRIEKFDLLFGELKQTALRETKDSFSSSEHFRNKAFFEAYFSNYIEGTVFEIEEAEQIVFQHKIPEDRPKDAHDILSTFKIISDANEMKKTPSTFHTFESLILNRHGVLMESRPEIHPGYYKTKPNRAGGTHFTPPELVTGTLELGFERYLGLPKGLSRAIFMMFLIAEVHPFTDGNGRMARIMMNAELFSQGLTTLIIPTVYREDYLLSLRSLTRRNRPRPLVQMLSRAQQFSHLNFSSYPETLRRLEEHNWFKEPEDAKLIEP